MRDFPFAPTTCDVVVAYTNTNVADGYTDVIDTNNEFEFTRVSFYDLSDAAKHRLCNGGVLGPDDLAPGTFALLLDVPLFNGGEGLDPTTGFRPCCCHCAPRLYVAPLTFEDEVRQIGTRTYTDTSTAPIYVSEVSFALFPTYCRRGIALQNLEGVTGPVELDATLTNVVVGSEPLDRDQEITVTWPLHDRLSAGVNVDWLSPSPAPYGIPWRFFFAASRNDGEYFAPYTLPVITLQPGATPEQEAAYSVMDETKLFRLSARPNGGRIGFIGAYGAQVISGLTMTGTATGEGYTYDATVAPRIGPELFTHNINSEPFLSIGRGIEVDPCPDDWSAQETYDIMTGEDVTGEATVEVNFVP